MWLHTLCKPHNKKKDAFLFSKWKINEKQMKVLSRRHRRMVILHGLMFIQGDGGVKKESNRGKIQVIIDLKQLK